MTRCTATLTVPTQDHPVRCTLEAGHEHLTGNRMHHGTDDGPGATVRRSWISGRTGDGQAR